MNLTYTAHALFSLDLILTYIATKYSIEQAVETRDEILKRADILREYPLIGKKRGIP